MAVEERGRRGKDDSKNNRVNCAEGFHSKITSSLLERRRTRERDLIRSIEYVINYTLRRFIVSVQPIRFNYLDPIIYYHRISRFDTRLDTLQRLRSYSLFSIDTTARGRNKCRYRVQEINFDTVNVER